MAESSKPTRAVEVFFSYSHKDEDLRDELSKHLALLKRQRVITDWHDRRIGAGKEWENEIDEHLNTADIILLLVSSDFLASDYCYDVEVKTAMKRHDDGEARVIPVILRHVDLKGALFRNLQALPRDARPVTDWPNRDEAFLNVAQGIRVAAEELVLSQIRRLFASLDKVERLKNWANVISLGERILESLPDHLPEYQTARSKTAAAYVKRWARCFDESLQDLFGCVRIKTKRNEDAEKIRDQIMADLNRAIELDPEVGEYYYLRYSMRRLEFDYDYEGEIELGNIPYTRESVQARESDLARAIELDPSIAEALRDLKSHSDLGYEGLRIRSASPTFSWDEFLANPPKPIEIKEPWRLKCLRD
ncbi:MAG: toll/interleukin-1 receptor domain-containing protein [Blastocatellia bacterium]